MREREEKAESALPPSSPLFDSHFFVDARARARTRREQEAARRGFLGPPLRSAKSTGWGLTAPMLRARAFDSRLFLTRAPARRRGESRRRLG